MNAASATPCRRSSARTATTTSTPNTAAAIAARLIGAPPGRRLSSRSSRRWRGDLLGVLARLRAARSARRARPCPPGCRGACACACASSGPSGASTLRDRREHLLDQVPLRVEAAQRHVLGEALERRPRREPDQLRLGDLGARSRTRSTIVAQRHRAVVVHVRGHLRAPALLELEADRAHARQAAAGLAQLARRSRSPASTSSVARSTLKATSGGRAATSTAPAVGCGAARAEVGHELARSRCAPPAPPGRRGGCQRARVLGPGRQLAVEEHRHAELLADQRGGGERLGAGGAAPLLVEVDDRHHVERAHVRVDARRARRGRSARPRRARRPSQRRPPARPAARRA